MGNLKSVFKIQIGIFLANTLVEYILQACIYQENMEKCEKYKADGYAGR